MNKEKNYQEEAYKAIESSAKFREAIANEVKESKRNEAFEFFEDAVTVGGEYEIEDCFKSEFEGWPCMMAACEHINTLGVLVDRETWDVLGRIAKEGGRAVFDRLAIFAHDNPANKDWMIMVRFIVDEGDEFTISEPLIMLQGGCDKDAFLEVVNWYRDNKEATAEYRSATRQ